MCLEAADGLAEAKAAAAAKGRELDSAFHLKEKAAIAKGAAAVAAARAKTIADNVDERYKDGKRRAESAKPKICC